MDLGSLLDLNTDTSNWSAPHPIHFSTSSTCHIYSCKLKRAYPGIDHVVCKLSVHEKGKQLLKHEAGIYEQAGLAAQLGTKMPRFFGLYEGSADGIGICCIVLEHCGMPLGQQGNLLCDQREDFRVATVRAYEQLHLLGFTRSETTTSIFNQHHILKRSDGTPCIVDFSSIFPHECLGYPTVTFNVELPLYPQQYCDEVRCIAEYADAWEPVSLYFPQAGGILGRKRLRLPQGVFYDPERHIDREQILTSVSPYVWAQIAPSADDEDDEVNWDRARELVEEAVASYEQRMADRRKKLRSQEPDSLGQDQREK